MLKLFAGDLSLHEASKTSFRSLHDCFTRELKAGARPIDAAPQAIVSPCDAIVGACGAIRDHDLMQAKGRCYTLDDLLGDARLAERYRNGQFVTLRLTSNMYHRFHAPCELDIEGVTYVPGDLFNVNAPALKRIARLYCRNERAAIHGRLKDSTESIALVAVGAILVGSIHLHCAVIPAAPNGEGPRHIPCATSFCKGEELGYFQHGSTIIIVTSAGIETDEHIRQGSRIKMGERLLRHVRCDLAVSQRIGDLTQQRDSPGTNA